MVGLYPKHRLTVQKAKQWVREPNHIAASPFYKIRSAPSVSGLGLGEIVDFARLREYSHDRIR